MVWLRSWDIADKTEKQTETCEGNFSQKHERFISWHSALVITHHHQRCRDCPAVRETRWEQERVSQTPWVCGWLYRTPAWQAPFISPFMVPLSTQQRLLQLQDQYPEWERKNARERRSSNAQSNRQRKERDLPCEKEWVVCFNSCTEAITHPFGQGWHFCEILTASHLQFLHATVNMRAMLTGKLFHTLYWSLNI